MDGEQRGSEDLRRAQRLLYREGEKEREGQRD